MASPLILIEDSSNPGSDSITDDAVTDYLDQVAEAITARSPGSVLFVPPDITRIDSQAGFITSYLYRRLPPRIKKAVLPATGLHRHMSDGEKELMFGEDYHEMEFLTHNPHREGDNQVLGRITQEDCQHIFTGSQEGWDFLWDDIEVVVNRKLSEFDIIVSIGQVLPHEITGMANYHKNILIGLGGKDFISKSHFIGAVIGIPEVVGKAINPVREFLKMVYDRFVRPRFDIDFVFTVVGGFGDLKTTGMETDHTRLSGLSGLFYGNDDDLFYQACRLSEEVNITSLPSPCDRVWVRMPPKKYHSLWLANKAIYRTHGIIKQGGELIIDAPGIRSWGESSDMDRVISRFGYRSVQDILERLRKEISGEKPQELLPHLAVAAHLIHGYHGGHRILFVDHSINKSDGNVGKHFYEGVGFGTLPESQYQKNVLEKFSRDSLDDLYRDKELSQTQDGERNYYINDAGLGFWKISEDQQ